MSEQLDIVTLFEKVCYRGLDVEKVASQVVTAWGKDLTQNSLRAAVAWIAAGANVARLAESAKKGKVNDAATATNLSSTVISSLGSVKMTHWAKAFSPVILFVRIRLAQQNKIAASEIWADTAFLGFHDAAFKANVTLALSIAESKGNRMHPSDAESSSRRYANIALEKSPEALKSFFTSMAAGKKDLTLQMAIDVVRDLAKATGEAPRITAPITPSDDGDSRGTGGFFGRGGKKDKKGDGAKENES